MYEFSDVRELRELRGAVEEPVVWVVLRYRSKRGKPTHRFKYEKRVVAKIGTYRPDLRAWRVPLTLDSLRELETVARFKHGTIFIPEDGIDWEDNFTRETFEL